MLMIWVSRTDGLLLQGRTQQRKAPSRKGRWFEGKPYTRGITQRETRLATQLISVLRVHKGYFPAQK